MVRQIRTEYATGKVTQKTLSEKYNVGTSSLNSLLLRKTWQHTDDIQPPAKRGSIRTIDTRGGNKANKRLTPEQVRSIRQHVKEGVRQATLARQFNVTPGTINNIITGKAWSDLPNN
jgi:uncharacterized protein YjcR